MSVRIFCSVLLAIGSFLQGNNQSKASDQVTRFLVESPVAWKKLQDAYHHLSVEYTESMIELGPLDLERKVLYEDRFTYEYSGAFRRRHLFRGDKEVIRIRRGNEYTFEATRNSESSGLVISDLTTGSPDSGDQHLADSLLYPVRIVYDNLSDLLKSNRFIVDAAELVDSVPERVTVSFHSTDPLTRFAKGTVELIPSNLWAIAKYSVVMRDGNFRSVAITYGEKRGDFVPIQHIVEEYRGKESSIYDPPAAKKEIVFRRFEHSDLPRSHFSLAAVGLTEIQQASGLKLAILCGFFGLVIVAIGVLVSRRAQKE